MSKKYDLKKMLEEIREDEEDQNSQVEKEKTVSQDEIKKMLAGKRKGDSK